MEQVITRNPEATPLQRGLAGLSISTPALGRRNLIIAGMLAVAAFVMMAAFDHTIGISIRSVSYDPHYIYQAYSFLHGKWNLDLPARMTDIVVLNGKHYIVYPPFPAIVFLPFVAVFGLHTSDVFLTLAISACNLGVLFLLFEQARESGFTRRLPWENVVIATVLFFGSINFWLSLGGRLWFTAQIISLTCTMLALLLALRHHFVWATVFLGFGFFSRATVILGFPFLLYLAWEDAGTDPRLVQFVRSLWQRRPDFSAVPWRRLMGPIAVAVLIVLAFAARNLMIFGNPLETGYDVLIQQRYPQVTTGPFNISYVPANIIANFFSFPRVIFTGPFDRHPTIDWLNGGYCVSVFVTTPLFLYMFWRNRKFSLTRAMLWGVLGLVVLAVLLFHAAGWYQFGARYLFDGYAFAFLLLVLTDMRVDWRFGALGALGIIINIMGALQFWH